jgi:low temperature requirement protein LtrA
MATDELARRRHLSAALRQDERVSTLELFFDLVFVLAITQCTQLMSDHLSWSGIAEGMLMLGMLWWSWVGYAWLTSVVDPEDDAVRLTIFVAMAALLIVALAVPRAFGSLGLTFALAYGVVRVAHLGLFVLGSADDPNLRRSVIGLAVSTVVAVSILIVASQLDGAAQGIAWLVALLLDTGGPFFFGSEGWKIVPAHFAERHGLILIIALGESIVAIGVGVGGSLTFGQGVTAVTGIALAAALWWVYFDVVALVSARRLEQAAPGREQNEMARDSYSYMHYPMVAGIVLAALGLKKTLAHVDHEMKVVTAFALLGGVAIYLLAIVAFRYRHVRSVNPRRLILALLMLAFLPAATAIPAIATVAVATVAVWVVIVVDTRSYGEGRNRLRHAE